jgi:UDP-N-acetyl-D-mannosaminuronic acid transferase (WecB/TagA/CpsF family)
MKFCNINFNIKNRDELLSPPAGSKTKVIITVNAAFIVTANTEKRFFDILNSNYVTFDGAIPYIAAKILFYLGFIH